MGFHTIINACIYIETMFEIPIPLYFLGKQILIYSLITRASANKQPIFDLRDPTPHLSRMAVAFYMCQSVLMESLSYSLAYSTPTSNIPADILTFIPVSFLFEIMFDFFHYWSHRCMHALPQLAKYHHIHHTHVHIRPISAFQHHWVDLLLTNVVPFVLTSHALCVSNWTLIGIMWYKSIVEIGGHCGKVLKTSSFPQCIWLPRLFGIELYSQHHADHHRCGTRMFGKRFTLWDRVFGTSGF